jgi:hypothetical protein
MKRIKKFEGFNYRMPEEVTEDEWNRKCEIYGDEPFDKKEMDFFEELYKQQTFHRYRYKGNSIIFMEIYTSEDKWETIDISISKLSDDWYAICFVIDIYAPYYNKYYIADEWEEVLGFLKNKTDLII